MAFALAASGPALAYDGWHLVDQTTIESKSSSWDYVSLDSKLNRLYIGHRKEGLQVFDLATKKLIKVIDGTAAASSNGALIIQEFDLGLSNNENGSIIPFKLSTLEVQPAIKLGEELDTSHYDPLTKRVIVNMVSGKDGTDLIVLEAPTLKQVGVIKVGTKKPEHAEADGAGNFYLAGRDTEKVYKIDTRSLAVSAEWATPGCGQTNSIALDVPNKRVLVACRGNKDSKPAFSILNAEDGKTVATHEIGGGNDGIYYDAELKRVFMTGGVNGVMNIFEQVDANTYKQIEAVGTSPSTRTMAYDAKAKKIYTVTADGVADYAKKVTTSVSPWYPNTFFPNTFKVQAYGK